MPTKLGALAAELPVRSLYDQLAKGSRAGRAGSGHELDAIYSVGVFS